MRVDKHLSEMFPIKNGLRQGDALSSLLFNFVLEYANCRVQVNQNGFKSNGSNQRLVYADYISIWGESVYDVRKNTEELVVANKEIGIELILDKYNYMLMTRDQNTEKSHSIKIDFRSFGRVEEFKYLGKTLINQNSIPEEIKSTLKSENAFNHLLQNLLPSSLLLLTHSTVQSPY